MQRLTILLVLIAFISLPGMGRASAAPGTGLPIAAPASSTLPQASVTRATTMQVTDYPPVGTLSFDLTDSLAGSLPDPLNWYLHNFDPDHLSNLNVTWSGGGSCTIQPNNDIYCTGTLTQFTASYSYDYTPFVYGGYIPLGWSGSTSFYTDYTITVTYLDPLVYIRSLGPPPVQEGNPLIWYQSNTLQLDGIGLFYDPRVKVAYLPSIMK